MDHAVEFRLNLWVEVLLFQGEYSHETVFGTSRKFMGYALALGLLLAASPLMARRAPDPALKSLDGESRKLSSLRGQVVVVNFWATWCGPCQEELPRLTQLAASYAGRPVRFVAISIDEPKNRGRIPGTLAKLGVSLESWIGADTDTLGSFGLGDIVPSTVVLDERGEIVARVMGEARDQDVRQAVDWLLGGKIGPPPPALIKRY